MAINTRAVNKKKFELSNKQWFFNLLKVFLSREDILEGTVRHNKGKTPKIQK